MTEAVLIADSSPLIEFGPFTTCFSRLSTAGHRRTVEADMKPQLKKALALALALCPPTSASLGEEAEEASGFATFVSPNEGVAAKAVFFRTFYTGALFWYWQPSSLGSLSMRGHGTSTNGGIVRSISTCFYNESSFIRSFSATLGVRQANRTIQEVTFATTFSPLRHSCHTVNSFAATVEPGAYEIVTTYNRATGDNFWAGLSSTDGGLTFDVQIGTARPPFATGPQGPIQIRGVGISYTIDENDEPPPPPPPPPCEAPCLNNRFKVKANYTLQNGTSGLMGHTVLSPSNAAFYFTNSNNLELFVKILDACAINNTYWVFASGLTNQGITITFDDTLSDQELDVTNPLGRLFQSFVATNESLGAFSCNTD